MACLVEVAVIFTRLLVYAARRNHNLFAFLQQWLDQPGLCVIPFVCNDGLSQGVFKQNVGTLQIMALPRGEVKACWIAQRIDRSVDLGTQTATATSNCLFVQAPFFCTRAVRGARTMVESVRAYFLAMPSHRGAGLWPSRVRGVD